MAPEVGREDAVDRVEVTGMAAAYIRFARSFISSRVMRSPILGT
jgi:hypothetical protein